jgi:hypothetical protein
MPLRQDFAEQVKAQTEVWRGQIKMGVTTPCEKSKPLAIQEVKLVPPGRGGPNESRGVSRDSR